MLGNHSLSRLDRDGGVALTIAGMDSEKVAFLFGQPPDEFDPDDADDRTELLGLPSAM